MPMKIIFAAVLISVVDTDVAERTSTWKNIFPEFDQRVTKLIELPRLRGGMGVFGTIATPPYCEKYDGDPSHCKCMPGCRCAHCNERTGFKNIMKGRYPRPQNLSSFGPEPKPTLSGNDEISLEF